MRKFFSRNIDSRGRLVRGIGGVLLVLSGIAVCSHNTWGGVGLILSGGFMLLEAVRGWCILRACGIRTKL